MRAKVKKEIRLAKRLFERQISENAKGNPKRFFQYCSRKRKIKEEVRCIKNSKGELLYKDKDNADALNGYFVESFTKEEVNNTPEGIHNNLNVLANIEIEDKEVLDKLNKLKTNKAAGPDGIFPRVLKVLSEIIFKPLASIFRQSLETGEIPDDWKQGNIIPIYKKGDHTDLGNYRPISLTCIICKIMESIIRDKLELFIENNNILKDSQHGFRKGRSCLTNMLTFFEEATKSFDVGRAYDIVYLDFQKAFDKVPHDKLQCCSQDHLNRDQVMTKTRVYRDRDKTKTLRGRDQVKTKTKAGRDRVKTKTKAGRDRVKTRTRPVRVPHCMTHLR